MNTIIYTEYGGPEVLRYEEVELPSVGEHDVRVCVHAASVNHIECYTTCVRGVRRASLFGPTTLEENGNGHRHFENHRVGWCERL